MKTSIAPCFLSSRRVREIECKYANTEEKDRVRYPFPYLLLLRVNSHLQFGHSLLGIVASKSLSTFSNRDTRVAQKETLRRGSKEALSPKSKMDHSVVAESHTDDPIGVDSLLIHHETKRNYFTRAQLSRGGRSYSKSTTLCRGLVRLNGWWKRIHATPRHARFRLASPRFAQFRRKSEKGNSNSLHCEIYQVPLAST